MKSPRLISDFLAAVTGNWLSLVGSMIATAGAALILTFLLLDLMGFSGGPYLGILTFLILPGIFVLGLLLIPVGVFLARRRARRARAAGVEQAARLPVIDFNQPRTRNIVLMVVGLTLVNIVILAGATYKGVHVMDSTEFCGMACHSVMQPEFTAFQRSPHARVDCVDCHIGPGADWFVKSKITGAWQLVAVALDLYPRPIPTPIHDLRPARETCEQCHWPEKFVGDKLRVTTHFEEDEVNTETKSVLLLKVGGIQGRNSRGIHWHVDPNNRIRYLSDATRETIYDVELGLPDGSTRVYRNGDAPDDAVWREMDCVDCHNRPTHIYRQPDKELDLAMHEGRIARELPFIRREGMAALQANYESHDDARTQIAAALDEFYRNEYPDVHTASPDAIDGAAQQLGEIYANNVFPSMKVYWDTYPDHIGHQTNSAGCFRCHDRRHRTEQRERISKDCETCHTILADRESNPAILEQLLP
ncbi:MAG: NapC/NirT family cytochrome c [Gammaproteobacteria bacterium]|nr:NapC/NirT family cytochrome c [Gammaproteobacteria bacterium]